MNKYWLIEIPDDAEGFFTRDVDLPEVAIKGEGLNVTEFDSNPLDQILEVWEKYREYFGPGGNTIHSLVIDECWQAISKVAEMAGKK